MRVDKAFSQTRKNESKAKSCIIMQKVNPSDEKRADETHKMNNMSLKMRKTARKRMNMHQNCKTMRIKIKKGLA